METGLHKIAPVVRLTRSRAAVMFLSIRRHMLALAVAMSASATAAYARDAKEADQIFAACAHLKDGTTEHADCLIEQIVRRRIALKRQETGSQKANQPPKAPASR